jgi:hypothetical protein
MRTEERERMHEGIDRPELAAGGRAIEPDDHARYGALPETDANEVAGNEVEPVGNEVAERARGPPDPREDGDLRGPRCHKS